MIRRPSGDAAVSAEEHGQEMTKSSDRRKRTGVDHHVAAANFHLSNSIVPVGRYSAGKNSKSSSTGSAYPGAVCIGREIRRPGEGRDPGDPETYSPGTDIYPEYA